MSDMKTMRADRPLIVIADEEESYVTPLLLELTREFGNNVAYEVITDHAYYETFFSSCQSITALLVSADWWSREEGRAHIDHVFLLVQSREGSDCETGHGIHSLKKYSSVKEICQEICYVCGDDLLFARKSPLKTKCILVCSPVGGCGKTTLALGICEGLSRYHKRVLYMDAEYLQTFQRFLTDVHAITPERILQLCQNGPECLSDLTDCTGACSGFSYLRPFPDALSTYGLTCAIFPDLADCLRKRNAYDYVIIDTDSAFGTEKLQMIASSDRVVLITEYDERSQYALGALAGNLNYSDKSKYIIAGNKYRASDSLNDCTGTLTAPEPDIHIEYMTYQKEEARLFPERLSHTEGMKKLTELLLYAC